mgnify:CR=1 FL=1
MKTLSRRAWVLYLLAIAFISGACILFYTFYTNADAWAMKKANRHIYSSGTLTTAGAVYDSTGAVLAQTVDGKRVYNKDKDIRVSTCIYSATHRVIFPRAFRPLIRIF